jgi:thiol:disulfide interchange protein DsbD
MLKRFSYILFVVITALFMPLGHAANSSSLTDNLFSRDKAEDEFLSPDVAFGVDIVRAKNEINAHFKVADGYYLYKQRIKFTLTPELAHTIKLPAGEIKDDPNFGKMEVYHHDFTGVINAPGAASATITIKVTRTDTEWLTSGSERNRCAERTTIDSSYVTVIFDYRNNIIASVNTSNRYI